MASIGKIHTYQNGIRSAYVQAVAAFAGVKVEEVVHENMLADDELRAKFNVYLVPAFEGADGINIVESGAIAAHVAEAAPNSGLIPSEPKAKAEVLQYHALAAAEISAPLSIAGDMFANRLPYTKPAFQGIIDKVVRRLQAFEKVLTTSTFLVGERITLADVSLALGALAGFAHYIEPATREQLPNVVRLTETVIKNSKVEKFFSTFSFLTEAPKYVAPAKEKKADAPKKAAEPKAAKAPKAKEAADDDDEPLVPAEPKAKNPLDDLPKSSFNLEEWKRQYSNLDTRKEALPWLYENFDKDGFSIYRVDFKYNDELTLIFMAANQVGGFFNRLEASRKYLFGSVGVLGKANDAIISGAIIVRGQEAEPVVSCAPDWESYSFTRLDLEKADEKEFFEGAMAWDLVVDGKEWADGKNFK